jgi:type II secretory pathway pseudopilin PulG
MATAGQQQAGFTFLGLLFAIVVLGIALAAVGIVWSTQIRREREAVLLFVGDQYRAAIGRYVAAGGRYPQSLEELVTDDRSPVPRHFLRRLYRDPMTAQADWQLIEAPGGGIMGVASSSQAVPIKVAGFSGPDALFENAQCYCAWQFVFDPRRFGRGRASRLPIAPRQ